MPSLPRKYPMPNGISDPDLHPRETFIRTGLLAVANASLEIPLDGCSTLTIDMRGTFNATWILEATVDGSNYQMVPFRPINQAAIGYQAAAAGATQGSWVASIAGYRSARVRLSAYTSGGADCSLAASNAPIDQSLLGALTTTVVTNTGAAGAGVTLTLPAPGAGLRQMLTYLAINRINGTAAALTAAAGPVNVTSTNLPGSPVFAMGNDALPAGAVERWREDFAYAIAAAAQNTATTLVAPTATGVIWRMTAGYYIAP